MAAAAFADISCTWGAPVEVARDDGGAVVALQVQGTIGKRARAAILKLGHLRFLSLRQVKGIDNRWLAAPGALPALRSLDLWSTCLDDHGAAGLARSTTLLALEGNAGAHGHILAARCRVAQALDLAAGPAPGVRPPVRGAWDVGGHGAVFAWRSAASDRRVRRGTLRGVPGA